MTLLGKRYSTIWLRKSYKGIPHRTQDKGPAKTPQRTQKLQHPVKAAPQQREPHSVNCLVTFIAQPPLHQQHQNYGLMLSRRRLSYTGW
ncbi:hypothetical protein AMEX_G5789 [Astyanax mexicanus]|uniref:Uncharacterized protein n=1 Tax=Astyanax mexicanus TaxID=7994 RepID=A0A8T2M8R8_ASTMX|nr:hypothetical protein AMEX_G5789 [Astyanax mexicanus]